MNCNLFLKQMLMGAPMTMPRFLFAVIGLLFAATLAPSPLYAAANVLLPPENPGNDGSKPFPSLGLSVQTPKTAPDSTKKTDAPETKSKATAAPEEKTKKSPSSDSKIILQTEVPDVPANKSLPHNLNISLGKDSSIGEKDSAKIAGKLGLNADEISSNCILTIRGTLITDKSTYAIGNGMSRQATVYYDGRIKNYSMMVQALCRANDKLPPDSGTVVKIKDRFVVVLQPIRCAPPTGSNAASLIITYNGIAAAQCEYQ